MRINSDLSTMPESLEIGSSSDSSHSSFQNSPPVVRANVKGFQTDHLSDIRPSKASIHGMIKSLRSQDRTNLHAVPIETSSSEDLLTSGLEMEILIKNEISEAATNCELSKISDSLEQGGSSDSNHSSLRSLPLTARPNEWRFLVDHFRGTRPGKASINRRVKVRENVHPPRIGNSNSQDLLSSGRKMELLIKEQQLGEVIAASKHVWHPKRSLSRSTISFEDTRRVALKSGPRVSSAHENSPEAPKIPASDSRRLGEKPYVDSMGRRDDDKESRDLLISNRISVIDCIRQGETPRPTKDATDSMDCEEAGYFDNCNVLDIEQPGDLVKPNKIPATDSRRLGAKHEPVGETDCMDSSEETKDTVTTKKIPALDIRRRLGEKPQLVLETTEPMDCDEMEDAVTFGCVSSVTNVVKPIIDFNRPRNTVKVPATTVHSTTHIRRSRKPEVVKPTIEQDRTGKVARYNGSDGYGFITVDSAHGKMSITENLFFHYTGLKIPPPLKDTKVKFEIVQGKKGYEATNVSFLS